jgi:hypothetical protein
MPNTYQKICPNRFSTHILRKVSKQVSFLGRQGLLEKKVRGTAKKNNHEIRDPIYAFIHINSSEREVLNSAPVQRLRHIHQLALTSLVYPGHSIVSLPASHIILSRLPADPLLPVAGEGAAVDVGRDDLPDHAKGPADGGGLPGPGGPRKKASSRRRGGGGAGEGAGRRVKGGGQISSPVSNPEPRFNSESPKLALNVNSSCAPSSPGGSLARH